MGETVDALGYKADVPARTRDSIQGRIEGVRSKLTGATAQVSEATPDAADVKHAGRRAVGVAQENPLGLAIGAAAVGFLAGMLVPSTRIEDERIGHVADEVKEQVQQTAHEALDRGKQVAQETAEAATQSVKEAASDVKETAEQTAQQHGEELKQSVQESAQQVQSASSA
jgi:gas vesicle protein